MTQDRSYCRVLIIFSSSKLNILRKDGVYQSAQSLYVLVTPIQKKFLKSIVGDYCQSCSRIGKDAVRLISQRMNHSSRKESFYWVDQKDWIEHQYKCFINTRYSFIHSNAISSVSIALFNVFSEQAKFLRVGFH